ncbi:MAG TPA: TIGR04211 family SH3 domain-containing protein [Myxococcota bacterium]|nr:TIGR04211 family SH3 domain-containing protein [Myxococcota bacterium]
MKANPRALVIGLACLSLAASAARADYIGGEVRVNLRAGPGLEFRILKILTAGTQAQKIGGGGEWVQVRAADIEGWIPRDNLTSEEPATLALPRVREKLTASEARIAELEQKVKDQGAQLEQLANLRERNRVLEDDAASASANARWKTLATGAAITLVGILIGLVAPRGSGQRSRLKL